MFYPLHSMSLSCLKYYMVVRITVTTRKEMGWIVSTVAQTKLPNRDLIMSSKALMTCLISLIISSSKVFAKVLNAECIVCCHLSGVYMVDNLRSRLHIFPLTRFKQFCSNAPSLTDVFFNLCTAASDIQTVVIIANTCQQLLINLLVFKFTVFQVFFVNIIDEYAIIRHSRCNSLIKWLPIQQLLLSINVKWW